MLVLLCNFKIVVVVLLFMATGRTMLKMMIVQFLFSSVIELLSGVLHLAERVYK